MSTFHKVNLAFALFNRNGGVVCVGVMVFQLQYENNAYFQFSRFTKHLIYFKSKPIGTLLALLVPGLYCLLHNSRVLVL